MTYKPVDDCEHCWASKDGCLGVLQFYENRRCCERCTHPELRLPEFGDGLMGAMDRIAVARQARRAAALNELRAEMAELLVEKVKAEGWLQKFKESPEGAFEAIGGSVIKLDDRHLDLLREPYRAVMFTSILPPEDEPEEPEYRAPALTSEQLATSRAACGCPDCKRQEALVATKPERKGGFEFL